VHMFVLVLKPSLHQISIRLSLAPVSIPLTQIRLFVGSAQWKISDHHPVNQNRKNPSLVPSSPVDISTYQTARTVLNEYMDQNSAFSTPVKTFVDRYIKSLDRVWTCNSITERKYNRLKEVSMDRKRRESGVRAV
jgi:hypothetical protein